MPIKKIKTPSDRRMKNRDLLLGEFQNELNERQFKIMEEHIEKSQKLLDKRFKNLEQKMAKEAKKPVKKPKKKPKKKSPKKK